MNPIYNEYITFLRNMSGEKLSDLEEGYFWLDKQIIKGFDLQGKEHKFYRVKVYNDLKTVEVIKPKKYDAIENITIISWQRLAKLQKNHLDKLKANSLKLVNECLDKYEEYMPIVLTSGGKDSSVIMDLVRQVDPCVKAVFNNTTLDCADTYKHIKMINGIKCINPNEGFYQWRKRMNFIPTRFSRACCGIFKEGATMDVLDSSNKYIFFLGMRNEESSARSGYEDYWKNEKWGDNWFGCLPIRKWSELDVWLYLLMNNISFNPKYKKGYARAGCAIACPFASKTTWVLDRYWYPMMRDRWENILKEDFVSNRKWTVMNCTINEYITQAWNGGMFRDEPTKEVLDEFAEYTGIDKSIVPQYFNKECHNCGKQIRHKQIISMNLKMHGRSVNKFYCKKCLMKEFDWNNQDWDNQIKVFKQQGCILF